MGFPKLFFAHVDDESISQVCFLLMLTTRAFPKFGFCSCWRREHFPSLVFAYVDDESISQNFSNTEKCDFQKNERDVKPSHFLIFMQDFRKLKSVNSAKILNRMAD
jgi:hypothetical protein